MRLSKITEAVQLPDEQLAERVVDLVDVLMAPGDLSLEELQDELNKRLKKDKITFKDSLEMLSSKEGSFTRAEAHPDGWIYINLDLVWDKERLKDCLEHELIHRKQFDRMASDIEAGKGTDKKFWRWQNASPLARKIKSAIGKVLKLFGAQPTVAPLDGPQPTSIELNNETLQDAMFPPISNAIPQRLQR